ncbi:hypothetical protein ALC53_10157 [Atta colombica]|uniref:Integrase catalytic domain-containing protein n=1 Tax=Atta colombica TaxID=520822 RepID=A0A195B516_9HYME|nr:hypothetical protein ALC53_10157 [Atta colombica]
MRLVYRKRSDKVLFLVSRAMEQDLFYKYHSDFGHFGIDKTFSTIYVDHFGPVDRTNATKKYIFLVIDAFTKFVKLYAIKIITSRE